MSKYMVLFVIPDSEIRARSGLRNNPLKMEYRDGYAHKSTAFHV